MRNVIIHGTGKLGQMVGHLLRDSPDHRVVAFTAEQRYCLSETLCGVPVIPVDDIIDRYPPASHEMLTVLGGMGGAGARRDLFLRGKELGYRQPSYIHPTALVQGDLSWGENCVIFPYAVIGFDGHFGDNIIVREKVYLGHDFTVGDHAFIGVDCTLGGGARIGQGSYIAMGTTVTNDVTLGEESFVGIGSLVLKDTEAHATYVGRPARKLIRPTPGDSSQ